MNKKEIQKALSNLPKPKYIYQRYNGKFTKYELIDDKCVISNTTGMTANLDDTLLLGKVLENPINLIEARRFY